MGSLLRAEQLIEPLKRTVLLPTCILTDCLLQGKWFQDLSMANEMHVG